MSDDKVMDKVWVGVDPGFRGAIAAIYEDNTTITIPMPIFFSRVKNKPQSTTIDGPVIKEFFSGLGAFNIQNVLIEKAMVMPQQGIVSSAKFVAGQRFISGICEGMGLHYQEIRPTEWKRKVFGKSGKTNGTIKGDSMELVQKMFPEADIRKPSMDNTRRLKTISHDMAEAVLLAWYARCLDIGFPENLGREE